MIRVLLAEDHLIFRECLKSFLEKEGIEITGEASQGLEAAKLAVTQKPDVAVLDISMPVMNGLDAAVEIHKESPQTKILLLTLYDEACYVARALKSGVRGYLLKTQSATDLVYAIRHVYNGGVYLSPGISSALVDAYLSRDDGLDLISTRERQVLQLIGEGKSSKGIAALLGLSIKTVESHRERIMRKLGVHEIASLVRYAIRCGLVAP